MSGAVVDVVWYALPPALTGVAALRLVRRLVGR